MSNKKIQLPPIDLAAVPVFLHAFRLAACTAMMMPDGKQSQALFDSYSKLLAPMCPNIAKFLDSEERIYNIGLKLATCKTWMVFIKESHPSSYRYEGWKPRGNVAIKVDDWEFVNASWKRERLDEDSDEFKAFVEFAEMVAGIDAQRIIPTYDPVEE